MAALHRLSRVTFASLSCTAVAMAVALAGAAGCGSTPPSASTGANANAHGIDVELPQLEIYGDGVERFANSPPSGDVTQGWIPKIADWKPPPADASAGASATPSPIDHEIAIAARIGDPPNAPTPTERAIRDTLAPFRTCHQRGLLHDPTQDGHVAVVVRVGADGRVVKSESYGACELSREVVACMVHVGRRLRFEPPAGGSASIILPAVFAPRSGIVRRAPGSHDEYAAAASVSLEDARAGLHDCERRERRAVRSQEAWATFIMEIDAKGHVVRQNIEPWSGNQELLKCASDVLGRIQFPVPESGTATVRSRITFNPRGILGSE
jgi:hypothetical protein